MKTIKRNNVFLVLAIVFSMFYIRLNSNLLWSFFYTLSLAFGIWILRDKDEKPNYCRGYGKKIKY